MLKRTVFLCCFITACSDTESTKTIATQNIGSVKTVAYTYHSDDGNRLVAGQSDIPNITPRDIPLAEDVFWITALKSENASIWVAVLSNGDTRAYKVTSDGYESIPVMPDNIGAAMPITAVLDNQNQVIIANNFSDGSPYTSPVILNKTTGSRAYIAKNGDLVLSQGDTSQRLAIDAVKYSRILVDDNKNLLLLTKPTLSYDHQVLGDDHPNAAAITLVTTSPDFQVKSTININAPDVLEGNPLIWKDVNNDGNKEIITTLSNINTGARIVVFNEDGTLYSEGTSINQGYRWRHQLMIGPFNSDNEQSLASIYIPHLEPHIEFFRLDDESMTESRFALNYTSHLSRSLNLDKSIAGDFDNDGKPEILLINRDTESELAGISLSNNQANTDWTLNLNGKVSSNVAAVTLDNKQIALGVGQGKSLRVWQP